jgi:hypothetical protein
MDCRSTREDQANSCFLWKQFVYSLGCSLVEDLLLEGSGLCETKSDLVGGELVVAVSNNGKSGEHHFSVEWVEKDLFVLSSVSGNSGGSAGEVGWEALYTVNISRIKLRII